MRKIVIIFSLLTWFLPETKSQAVFVKDTVKICGSEIYFPLEFQAQNCINQTNFFIDINYLSMVIPGTGGPYFWKNPALIGSVTTQQIGLGLIRVHYLGTLPVSIPDGTPLFTLSLRYLIGTTTFQLSGSGGSLDNAFLTPVNPMITQQPTAPVVATGYPADFAVMVNYDYDLAFEWEVSMDNGNTFIPLDTVVPYVGTTTAHLIIDPVEYSMDGNLYRCHLTGCGASFYSNAVSLSVLPPATIYVSLKYNSVYQTPLDNTEIYLRQNGVTAYTLVTDNTGEAVLTGLEPGTYEVQVNYQHPWGGGNSLDALEIVKHFVGMTTLTGLSALAADTDHSGTINSVDALAVIRRFVGMDTSFPAGDWVSDAGTVTIQQSTNHYLDIKALCTGDVNRSYVP